MELFVEFKKPNKNLLSMNESNYYLSKGLSASLMRSEYIRAYLNPGKMRRAAENASITAKEMKKRRGE